MYTRGQLSLIGNVGRKAIRLYETEGLISATKINPDNGYHYYDDEQLLRIEKIKQYKKIGFSLSDIKSVMCNTISEEEILIEKRTELDKNIKVMQKLRRSLDKLDDIDFTRTNDEIDNLSFASCTCLYVEENVELENLGTSVGKLYEKASKSNIQISGSHFVKYEGLLNEDSTFKMTTCLPIIPSSSKEDLLEVKETKCIHMNFTGGFSKVSSAHIKMKKHIEENNILSTGTVFEVYNKDMSVDIYYEVK